MIFSFFHFYISYPSALRCWHLVLFICHISLSWYPNNSFACDLIFCVMFLVASLSCDNDSCRVVNVFIIWISIVSEFCPKLCEKGSSLSGFITAEVINCFSRQQ